MGHTDSQLDEEFSSLLTKISDRKTQLESVKDKLTQLALTKHKKEEAMMILERRLVNLLETQDNDLAEIRRRQDNKVDMAMMRKGHTPVDIQSQSKDSNTKTSTLDKQKTAQLMESTETMMKFQFAGMTMSYFNMLNMVRAYKSVSTQDMESLKQLDLQDIPTNKLNSNQNRDDSLYTTQMHSHVLNWDVDHVIQWLKSLSLDQYAESFRLSAVDGPFLCQLTDDDLMNGHLGVTHLLHRKKIMFGISQLTISSNNAQNGEPREFDEPSALNSSSHKFEVVSRYVQLACSIFIYFI